MVYKRKAYTKTKKVAVTKALVKKVNKLAGHVEKKIFDVIASGTVATGGLLLFPTSALGQGTTQSTRVGLKISPAMLQIKSYAFISSSATTTRIRFIVFQDKDQSGTAPVATDLIDTTLTGSVITVASVNAPYNRDNFARWRILSDRSYDMSISGDQLVSFDKKIKLSSPIYYSTAANPRDNNIFVLILHDQAVANIPGITYYSRLFFTDD